MLIVIDVNECAVIFPDEVGVIDLEYAGPNYLAFEIANHFCEFAGVHDIDFSLYPTEEVQKFWITAYLEESTGIIITIAIL